MTKQEILDAINSTIVANGQKGITAESLNNILNEMVNATPEGGSETSGGDSLKFYTSDLISAEMMTREFAESLIGTEEEYLSNVILEMLDNNAALYAKIMEILQNALASLDEIHAFAFPAITIEKPFECLLYGAGNSTPASVGMVGEKFTIMPIDMGVCSFASLADSELPVLPGYAINEDGTYSVCDSSVIYVPAEEGLTLPEELTISNFIAICCVLMGAINPKDVKVAICNEETLATVSFPDYPPLIKKTALYMSESICDIIGSSITGGIVCANGRGMYKISIDLITMSISTPTLIQSFE